MPLRDFVKNFDDMSDDNGYQFKFHCDICGDGFLSQYRRAPFSRTRSILGAAESVSSTLGGIFGRGSFGAGRGAADELHNTQWREAKEKAFDEAVAEARAHFSKCPSCTKYVDATCWNEQAQMCVECAPRLAVEVQKAKAQAMAAKGREAMSGRDFSGQGSLLASFTKH